ncbi:MAG TPA: hypothetical protein VFH33_01965, partial [Candidatus Krumholzibacteria bacterium]|nr:hypothetical protein [Candidatus Krumholzibacteria bacterium]
NQKMANDLVAEVPMVKYILSPDGRIDVPLSLTGGVLKPSVKVDATAMSAKFQKAMLQQGQKQVEDQVKTGVKGILDGLGKKKEPPKPAPAPVDTTKKKPVPPATTKPDTIKG